MNLNQVPKKFSSVTVDGWDGSTWTLGVGIVSIEVYSRFITERTFGVVKRIMISAEAIDPTYTLFRTTDGTTYLRSSLSLDMRNDVIYNYVYLVHIPNAEAEIVSFTTTPSASGMGSNTAEVKSPVVPCYQERLSSQNAAVVDGVLYTRVRILFPKGTVITSTNEVEISGVRYTVDEVDDELELVRAMCKEN